MCDQIGTLKKAVEALGGDQSCQMFLTLTWMVVRAAANWQLAG